MNANIIAAGQGALNKLTGDISNFVQGRAVNPMQEQMLDGVAFRSFNFTYDFYPKSADEARVVNQIIFAFRMQCYLTHSHQSVVQNQKTSLTIQIYLMLNLTPN